jgi:hypothetical protein
LHCQVFEGERRAVEQLEREGVHVELGERRNGGMAERAIGLAGHAGEIGLADGVADERADHLDGDFGIGASGEGGDGCRRELRPDRGANIRHIEAAVAGKTREHDLGETGCGSRTPGRDVMHLVAIPDGRTVPGLGT